MGLLLLVLILSIATAITAYRLPQTMVPLSYNIHLNLTEATFTNESGEYSGFETITIQARELTNEIQIHGAHDFINITMAHINNVNIYNITVDNETDIITLDIGSNLTAMANYTLYIEFISRVSTEDMYGFYKSSYTFNGTTKYLLITQFQPVYARRAFPCFDEPAFKATFEIYITNPVGMKALCNMPGQFHNTSDIAGDHPNLITTYFPPSGIMPTYLVTFIVSEFTCTSGENIETDSVPYRICSRDETNLTRAFAVDIGPSLLRSLNNFTNYTYGSMGFPKMDQVAIPDFAAGAMENWGLVTYQEQYLLWDSIESTNMGQQMIATTISHEFGHMWWGNLVTMHWWSETFLNEGFATYFQYFTTHDVLPEWELDKQFVVRVLQIVLEIDSFESSQPLQYAVNSDAQAMSQFSTVSYYKGGSIFRMVEHIMGTENFRVGLRTYLSTYAFRNTVREDLWTILNAQLENATERLPYDTTLGQVMENWVVTPGYPLIDVRLVDYAVIISQEGRFLLNERDNSSRWYVPISYTTNSDPNFNNTSAQEWLLPIGYIEVPFLVDSGWIILNNHATGYYRVNYNNLWDNITEALQATEFSGIPEVNRASLVDDAFHLARSNRINYTRMFSIIAFLKNDTSYYAWYPALYGFNFLLRKVGQDSALGKAISSHQLDLLGNIYATVPWTNLNDTNHVYTLKQVDVLSVACSLGSQNCMSHSFERFEEFRISGIRPEKNLRNVIYCNALRYSQSRVDWLYLWDSYRTTEIESEKVRILSALGCIENESILNEYLELILIDESGLRPQDVTTVFSSVYSSSSIGISIAFRFLQENHRIIEERYQSMNLLSDMIIALAEGFTTQSQINELRQFISNNTLNEDFHSVATAALAIAEANQLWLNPSWVELHEYFGLDPDVTDAPPNTTVPPHEVNATPPPDRTAPGGAVTISAFFVFVQFSFFSRSFVNKVRV